jgi:hypothetical protein
MIWQHVETIPPTIVEVGDIVALSLTFCNENIARAPLVFCKVKEISAPHCYKLYSPHGLASGSHYSSLISPLPCETWLEYPITSSNTRNSMAMAA